MRMLREVKAQITTEKDLCNLCGDIIPAGDEAFIFRSTPDRCGECHRRMLDEVVFLFCDDCRTAIKYLAKS